MATDSDKTAEKIKQLPDGEPLYIATGIDHGGLEVDEIGIATDDLKALVSELETAKRALEFYAENGRLCRLIHSEGDAGRNALAADGGKIAFQALKSD